MAEIDQDLSELLDFIDEIDLIDDENQEELAELVDQACRSNEDFNRLMIEKFDYVDGGRCWVAN